MISARRLQLDRAKSGHRHKLNWNIFIATTSMGHFCDFYTSLQMICKCASATCRMKGRNKNSDYLVFFYPMDQ